MSGRIPIRAAGFAIPLAAVAILAAACGGSPQAANTAAKATTTVAPPPAATSQSTTSAPAPTTPAGPPMALQTESGSYGVWLTDQTGRTLYIDAADQSGASSCTGACATAWPPLLTTGQVTVSGNAVAADLGTIKRTDGSTQVTYAGHPLYYFANENGPNQVKGLGAQGIFFLISPSGTVIKPPPVVQMAPPMTKPKMTPPPMMAPPKMTKPKMTPPPMMG